MPPPAPPPPDAAPLRPRIGVFDSGLGGVSVLRALRAALPQAELLYAADSGHAPYGERDDAHVLARSRVLTRHLRAQGAQMLLIACNTATAVAAQALRAEHPDLPIVGVEPGLKPALAATRNGRVGVMATTATLASPKFQRLLDELRAGAAPGVQIHLQACPGLAAAIESGEPQSPAVQAVVDRHAAPLRAAGVDTVVLGCTHCPFAAAAIARALGPGVRLIDTAEAVARQALRLAASLPVAAGPGRGTDPGAAPPAAGSASAGGPDGATLRLWSSGDPARLAGFVAQWLEGAEPPPPVARLGG